MRLAKNSQGEWVSADWVQEKDTFFCPNCQGLLEWRKGEKVKAYFAHVRNRKGKGESLEHRQAKTWLRGQFKLLGFPVEEEVSLAFDQRADVLVDLLGRKLAVEFQKSRLSPSTFKGRVEGYRKSHLLQWWIQNDRAHLPYVNREELLQYARYHPRLGCYQWLLDQESQQLILQYDLHINWRKSRQVIGRRLFFSEVLEALTCLKDTREGKGQFIGHWETKNSVDYLKDKEQKLMKAKQVKSCYQRYFRKSKKILDQSFAKSLYYHRQAIEDLPLICFWPPIHHLFSTFPLVYARYLLLKGKEIDHFLDLLPCFSLPFIPDSKAYIRQDLNKWAKTFL
ncbi:hypothetical protein D3H64_00055 [Atopobacter sp. AH10]|uniref:competence protein CoiA n=1 Tax=Atopobacter sp. AH10 TaxID=2315861 RepID=UPI000EF1C3A1|nr:competence protein CoiA family protein [Atopobacter sp. AH10]RLK64206.1 hypothetical protein D3H64_00055 [Atopobacter sp. AH10]